MTSTPTLELPLNVNNPSLSQSPAVSFDVLVIEDDSLQASLLAEFLRLLHYGVRVAYTAAQALEQVKASMPDLVLLDIHLPDGNGLELLSQLHQIDPHLSVITLSADKSSELLVESLAAGADEFLQKPLVFSELAIRLENVLTLVKFKKQSQLLKGILQTEKQLLSRYFSPQAIQSILARDPDNDVAPSISIASVLVFDLRNSTSMVEKLGATAFAEVLNGLMVDLMDLIITDGGNIVRLTGDGLIVTFPEPDEGGARAAIQCAQRISGHFSNLRRARLGPVIDDLRFGIGIATGSIFSGNIGTFRRMEFTIIGTTLSRATRLEALTKKIGTPILLDLPTSRHCDPDRLRAHTVLIRERETIIYELAPDTESETF